MDLPEVKKNEVCAMEITGMTHEGQGVGRINGFTVFVDDALVGEVIDVKIIKINKNFSIGKLITVRKASPDRAEPFCKAFKRCGGCSLQHLGYDAQLKYKTNQVKENLKRIGKLGELPVHDAIGMAKPFNYRNKAQFPVGMSGQEVVSGFYARRSHDIVDSSSCSIQDELSDKIRFLLGGFIIENKISVYNEETGNGLIRHIMTKVGFKTGEVMVVIVINGRELPAKQKLIDRLTGELTQIKCIMLNVNTARTNVILGKENIRIFGKDTITDYIGKYRFEISPLSFFQVNPVQTEVLYSKALEYSGLTGNETVFDVYCGIGTISLFLSEKAGKVYGVEVVEEAIEDAKRNSEINGVKNVEFIAGEAEKAIPRLYEQGVKADVVVVDPPRKGCDEKLLQTLVDMQPKRIVYVSCNPSTLARDMYYLSNNGFEVKEVQPMDMFPWTHHVECCVLIERKGLE